MDRRLDGRYVGNDFKAKRVSTGVAYEDGNFAMKVFKATYDVAANDSAGVPNTSTVPHGLGVYLPKGARLINSWFDVITKMSSATNGAHLAIGVTTASDIQAASLASAGMFQITGATQGAVTATFSTNVKSTAEKEVTVAITTEAMISGKMVIYGAYIEEKTYV